MFAIRRNLVLSAVGFALTAGCLILPAASGSAARTGEAPALNYDVDFGDFALSASSASNAAPALLVPAVAAEAPLPSTPQVDARELECMAKVVHHESRGQPRRGQLAVAQALVNRLKAGRFGDSICAVAAQPGQFFNVSSYHPRQDTADWDMAEDVSRDVLTGEAEQVAPGALFFRAAYASPNSFFRTRQRVASVGGHIFYR